MIKKKGFTMSTRQEQVRKRLEELIRKSEYNCSQLSKMAGKGPSYVQRFIKYGQPERLHETVRNVLSKALNVPEQELTDLILDKPLAKSNSALIDILDVKACCGSGNEIVEENVIGSWCMPLEIYKNITTTSPNSIKMIQVFGDSMQPTLKAGDWVLVDITHNTPDTDGLFVLWLTTGLAVKRIQGGFSNYIVHSDNPQYRDITASPDDIKIVGKVIYILKSERVG